MDRESIMILGTEHQRMSCMDQMHERKKLLDQFNETENSAEILPGGKRMMVFLRLKPLTQSERTDNPSKGCIAIENKTTIRVTPPPGSNAFKNSVNNPGKTVVNKFTFSRIFDENTGQAEFFEACVFNTLEEFIACSNNALIFTYGITNSGKTHTIQGSKTDPGILPRSLDVIFNSIRGKQVKVITARPDMFSSIKKLSPLEVQQYQQAKERIIKSNPNVTDSSMSDRSADSLRNSAISEGRFDMSDDSLDTSNYMSADDTSLKDILSVTLPSDNDYTYSVWISFAELYNELIYDMLEPIEVDAKKSKMKTRKNLIIREDRAGNPYIRNLNEIQVSSAEEAYNFLTIGQRNLKFAATKLNTNSSRSHCIFTIKLLRLNTTANKNKAHISMLSFCDLAGAERAAKTNARNQRMKEAGNINTSLLALSRCMTHLRYNQAGNKENRIVPYRESKLTRMFQSYFSGRGRVSMIVNTSQCANVFDETFHALRYSAIAKKIVIIHETTDKGVKRAADKQPSYEPTPMKKNRQTINWASPSTMLREMSTDNEVAKAYRRLCEDNTTNDDEDDDEEDDEDEDDEDEDEEADVDVESDHNIDSDGGALTDSDAGAVSDSSVDTDMSSIQNLDESLCVEQDLKDIVEDLTDQLRGKDKELRMLDYKLRTEIIQEMEDIMLEREKMIKEMHIKQLEIQTQTSQSRILILNNELKRVTEALDSAYSDSDESDTDTDNNRMSSTHRKSNIVKIQDLNSELISMKHAYLELDESYKTLEGSIGDKEKISREQSKSEIKDAVQDMEACLSSSKRREEKLSAEIEMYRVKLSTLQTSMAKLEDSIQSPLPDKNRRKDNIIEKIVYKEIPVEKIVYKEVIVEKKIIVEKEIPVEKIVIKEVEKIVEKIIVKEIPVEKIVIKEIIVEKEMPVEKIVEKEIIVEKKIPVEKIVIKEVEKIVEKIVIKEIIVEKEVPVEKIVEKEIIVLKEIPVEKIVVKEIERIVEKIVVKEIPVEKIVIKEIIIVKEVPVEKIIEKEIFVENIVIKEIEKIIEVIDDEQQKKLEKKLERMEKYYKNSLSDLQSDSESKLSIKVKMIESLKIQVKLFKDQLDVLKTEIQRVKEENTFKTPMKRSLRSTKKKAVPEKRRIISSDENEISDSPTLDDIFMPKKRPNMPKPVKKIDYSTFDTKLGGGGGGGSKKSNNEMEGNSTKDVTRILRSRLKKM